MNTMIKKSLLLSSLLVSTAALSTVVPYLQFRSQGFNAARELVGWQTQINKYDMCNFYGSFSAAAEYGRSFKQCRLANYLFGDALVGGSGVSCATGCDTGSCDRGSDRDCCDRAMIRIQGTKVANRDAKALMAENFYLPTDFDSEVTFKPTIENGLVDLNLYLGLDNWCEGLYFRVHMPIVHTRWDLKFCENIIAAGTNNYDPGYFNNTTTPVGADALTDVNVYGLARSQLLNSFEEFASGAGAITGVADITYNSLHNARMSTCRRHKTGVAELTAALGWNFLSCEDYTLGLNIRAAAPTGNRPMGEYLFEPIVGQGKHWELGGGLDARWVWWRSCDEDRDFTVYLDANVTHLFKTRQCRTFDLCNKPLSRYMLAMKFTDEVNQLVAGKPQANAVAPHYQFAKEFTPVANLTTLPVDVSAAVQGEIALKFAYTHCNWQFDVGYDFWGRSCEKITSRCDCADNGFKANTWGLKGDAFAFGFTNDDTALATTGTPLSATESSATIFKGTNNWPSGINGDVWNQNPGVDNPQWAWTNTDDGGATLKTHLIGYNTDAGDPDWAHVKTSREPVLLSEADLDINGARAKSMSNKVFGHIGYIWKDCECWTPYLGVGAEAEFGMCDKNCDKDCNKPCSTALNSCNTSCNTSCGTSCGDKKSCCRNVSLSQWGVWVKGGISFN